MRGRYVHRARGGGGLAGKAAIGVIPGGVARATVARDAFGGIAGGGGLAKDQDEFRERRDVRRE